MGQNGNVLIGSQWKMAWCKESTYGTDPGTASYVNPFGVVQTATLPDPVVDFQPIWTLGTASKRNWYVAYKGKLALAGSIPDIWLLNGNPIYLPIGACVTSGAGPSYTHTISEAVTLGSFALHATYTDSAGTVALMRRYLGGKVNRATFEAAEGDYLKMGIDEMVFVNLTNDQAGEPYYAAGVADITVSYPTTQPYLFSYGTLSLGGTTFARIRNFRLEVSNNLEPKYYVNTTAPSQLPYEYREGHKEYRMACQIDLEDAALYKELVRQGTYSSVYKGFQVIITFSRGASDTITFTMPSTTPAAGGDAMGCLIRTAPHNIVTDAVVSTQLDIIGRNLQVVVVDAQATVPGG